MGSFHREKKLYFYKIFGLDIRKNNFEPGYGTFFKKFLVEKNPYLYYL